MTMDPPPHTAEAGDAPTEVKPALDRNASMSEQSEDSQTAADFIRDQMQLEADAREAMPYVFDSCTRLMGPLRQSVFACLTCNPVPQDDDAPYEGAGVCYACSIQCHGEHTLVEIFNKRNFTCECGTTRFANKGPCILRIDPKTNEKGVHSEAPGKHDTPNVYNQNFRNRFCLCACDYDPFEQKGTMFQCLGLGTHLTGGCGEDWFHPGCLVGLGPDWYESKKKEEEDKEKGKEAVASDEGGDDVDPDDPPLPPGFPDEDAFEGFFCYKCVESNPWIKRYAGTEGFLPAVYYNPKGEENGISNGASTAEATVPTTGGSAPPAIEPAQEAATEVAEDSTSKKRKASDLEDEKPEDDSSQKRPKTEDESTAKTAEDTKCKLDRLPPAPVGKFNLFLKEGFRDHFCRCPTCALHLEQHPQLLEEEETYEPPLSEGGSENGGSTHGSGSLYERGESVLKNIDRVRAIEGVMAYNYLKGQLRPLFESFANSGKPLGANDIKDFFAKLRGDDEAIRKAAREAAGDGGEGGGDSRREQSGY